jgi:hypothetical protein
MGINSAMSEAGPGLHPTRIGQTHARTFVRSILHATSTACAYVHHFAWPDDACTGGKELNFEYTAILKPPSRRPDTNGWDGRSRTKHLNGAMDAQSEDCSKRVWTARVIRNILQLGSKELQTIQVTPGCGARLNVELLARARFAAPPDVTGVTPRVSIDTPTCDASSAGRRSSSKGSNLLVPERISSFSSKLAAGKHHLFA